MAVRAARTATCARRAMRVRPDWSAAMESALRRVRPVRRAGCRSSAARCSATRRRVRRSVAAPRPARGRRQACFRARRCGARSCSRAREWFSSPAAAECGVVQSAQSDGSAHVAAPLLRRTSSGAKPVLSLTKGATFFRREKGNDVRADAKAPLPSGEGLGRGSGLRLTGRATSSWLVAVRITIHSYCDASRSTALARLPSGEGLGRGSGLRLTGSGCVALARRRSVQR